MVTPVVVERHPFSDPRPRFGHGTIGLDEHLFVLQAPPQSLNEDVVHEAAFAVHADPDAIGLQFVDERRAGELNPLIGIKNGSYSVFCWYGPRPMAPRIMADELAV